MLEKLSKDLEGNLLKLAKNSQVERNRYYRAFSYNPEILGSTA